MVYKKSKTFELKIAIQCLSKLRMDGFLPDIILTGDIHTQFLLHVYSSARLSDYVEICRFCL